MHYDLIGPDSFWASLPYTIFSTVFLAIIGLLVIFLTIKVFIKYFQRRSMLLLNLGLALIFFVVAMAASIPVAFGVSGMEVIIVDKISRMLAVLAVFFYAQFGISIFFPAGENQSGWKPKAVKAYPYIHVAINVVLIVIHYVKEMLYMAETGERILRPPVLMVQEFTVGLPFIIVSVMAWQVSKRATNRMDEVGLKIIAASAVFKLLTYTFLAIDDLIVLENPSSLPFSICAFIAFLLFYLGIIRPEKVFAKLVKVGTTGV